MGSHSLARAIGTFTSASCMPDADLDGSSRNVDRRYSLVPHVHTTNEEVFPKPWSSIILYSGPEGFFLSIKF